METYLVLSGYVLYIFMCVFFMLAIGCIFYGCAYMKEAREHDKTKYEFKRLRRGYNKLIGEYHRATFKVPTVEVREENSK